MTNKMNPYLARFSGAPSLVAPEMQGIFEASLQQVQARLDTPEFRDEMASADEAWWGEPGSFRSMVRPYIVREGILHIPVKGVLLHDFPYQFGSWATGYDYIWKAFERGMADGGVRGIALVIDSPGGEVAGNFDLVDKMFAMKGQKPVRAYAMESAYSAAYSIASMADSITVSRTGGVGSIGVVTAHLDVSAAMERYGWKITFIHAGKHKVDGNPYEALKPEVKERIQLRIDDLYGIFVSTVARNRGMKEEAVRATEALTFTASEATSNGLADSIGSLEDAMATFEADLSREEEDETMAMTEDEKKAAAQAVETAKAEGITAGKAEGAKAQKDRINAIVGSEEGKKRPKAALSAALKTEMSVEEALAFIADLPEEKAETPAPQVTDTQAPKGKEGAAADFTTAMTGTDNPNLGASAGDEENKPSRAAAALARVKGPTPKAA